MEPNKEVIVVCCSSQFFGQAFDIKKELEKMGFVVRLPYTALQMKKSGDFTPASHKIWMTNPQGYAKKRWLINNHFRKIVGGDSILVINSDKNGITGYIGGNTLMEMGVALNHKKRIFVLNPVSDKHSYIEEIYGVMPIFLDGNLQNIRRYYAKTKRR